MCCHFCTHVIITEDLVKSSLVFQYLTSIFNLDKLRCAEFDIPCLHPFTVYVMSEGSWMRKNHRITRTVDLLMLQRIQLSARYFVRSWDLHDVHFYILGTLRYFLRNRCWWSLYWWDILLTTSFWTRWAWILILWSRNVLLFSSLIFWNPCDATRSLNSIPAGHPLDEMILRIALHIACDDTRVAQSLLQQSNLSCVSLSLILVEVYTSHIDMYCPKRLSKIWCTWEYRCQSL